MRNVYFTLLLTLPIFINGLKTEAQTAFEVVPDNYQAIQYTIPNDWKEGKDYMPKRVIFKLSETHSHAIQENTVLQSYLQSIGAQSNPVFPQAKKPSKKTDTYGRAYVDLTGIHEIVYTANRSVVQVINELKSLRLFTYVQPHVIIKPLGEEKIQFTPNDPGLSLQWHINKINAPLAWDISTGSPSVVVAVVDGGTNFSHADLQNIAYNLADPIDGIDNDADGWIDNYRGWNTGSNNNNPQYNVGGGQNHGVAVTGLASATVNNGTNGAGISYNSPYLHVKIADASNNFTGAEPGVFYAAEMGAKVINCSWGATSSWPLLVDVTRYAVINKGCLLVASAGNSNNGVPFYPASYEWVMGVAGSNASDIKSSTSSYYEYLDITAPGEAIYSTSLATFANVSVGTSWSAPIVSGSAALAITHFPSYTPEQIGALLKETSFNLYSLPGNAAYAGKLGRGRLDIGAALTTSPGPSINMITRQWSDGNDNVFSPGETVSLSGNFINWLNPSSPALRCTLRTTNTNITLIDSVVTIGVLNNLATFSNSSSPFSFVITPSCPVNTNVLFKLVFEDGSYVDKQFFSLVINPSYLNITENNLHTSLSSNGRIGYADENGQFGLGISKNGNLQHLVLSSFMLANDPLHVSDAGISASVYPFSADFSPLIPATQKSTPEIADFDAYGSFNDDNAGANKLSVTSNYKAWAWNDASLANFVIVEYTLHNTAASPLSNLFAGIYSYWEMPNGQFYNLQYMANWDATRKMGYGYNASSPVGSYAGVKLLSYDNVSWYAINNNGVSGSYNLFDGFSESEKYAMLANGVSRPSSVAGTVSGVLGTGPLFIPSGDSIRVAFALVLGDNLSEMQAAADSAQAKYDQLHLTWTGALSSDWNTPGNWFPNHVPNSCISDVYIPFTGNQPAISGNDFTVGNMRMDDNVQLTIQNGHTLNVCKNMTAGMGTGTEIIGGKTHLMGSSAQIIQGNLKIDMLELDNSSGAVIQNTAQLSIDSGLDLRTGTMTTNDKLTLLSDASGTAYLNNFSAGFSGNVSGNIHVERYIPIGLSGYRQLGTPVQLPNINQLTGFTPSGVPGFVVPLPTCDPNYVASNSPYGNWMQWVENASPQYACSQSLFQLLTSGGMQNGRGYYMGVNANSTLNFFGPANDGNINFPLSHTNGSITNGWNLVSNPYPSPLQWEMSNIPSGVDAIAKIWQTSGTYIGTFMDLDPSAVGTQAVAIGQGFQVRVSLPNTAPTFSVDNSDRTISAPSYLFAGNDPLTLQIDIIGNGFADLTKVRFITNSTTQFDHLYDSPKMMGNANQPMLYSIWQNEKYSTNSLGNLDSVYSIPLGVKIPQNGSFTLSFSNWDQFPATTMMYLEDTETNVFLDIRQQDTYTFSATTGLLETRFILHFYPPVGKTSIASDCGQAGSIELESHAPFTWNYTLSDGNGILSQGNLNTTVTISNLTTGTYVLQLLEPISNYMVTDSILLSGNNPVLLQPTASLFQAAVGQNIQFLANASQASSYSWNFGDAQQSILENPTHSYTAPGTYQVQVQAANANCTNNAMLTIEVGETNGIAENKNEDIVILFHNQSISIQMGTVWSGKTDILIYDSQGKTLINKSYKNLSWKIDIPAGEWAAGIYHVSLRSEKQTINRKIIKGML